MTIRVIMMTKVAIDSHQTNNINSSKKKKLEIPLILITSLLTLFLIIPKITTYIFFFFFFFFGGKRHENRDSSYKIHGTINNFHKKKDGQKFLTSASNKQS